MGTIEWNFPRVCQNGSNFPSLPMQQITTGKKLGSHLGTGTKERFYGNTEISHVKFLITNGISRSKY
jgi:hypothetical protein